MKKDKYLIEIDGSVKEIYPILKISDVGRDVIVFTDTIKKSYDIEELLIAEEKDGYLIPFTKSLIPQIENIFKSIVNEKK